MRRLASRVCAALRASIVVTMLAMLALSPLTLPRACDRCPPDCPMHARAATDDHEPLPCHQGERTGHGATADADCVVRASCGHDGAFLTSGLVRALLPDVLALRHVVLARSAHVEPTPATTHDPRAPLTAPPRPPVG